MLCNWNPKTWYCHVSYGHSWNWDCCFLGLHSFLLVDCILQKVSFLFFFFPLLLGRKLITLKFIVSSVKIFLLVSCTLWLNFFFVGSHYFIFAFHCLGVGFPGGSVIKNLPANAGDGGLIPGSGRSLGEGNGNPLQYSYLGKPVDRWAWWATVHGVAKELDMT